MSEPISKNALKKQQKAEEAAKKKAEKATAAATKASEGGGGGGAKKASLVGDEDADMDPTQYFNNRTTMLKRLEAEGINVYPHKFHCSMQLSEYVSTFSASLADGERKDDVTVNLAGRVSSIRQQGKLIFFDLTGEGVKVQLMSDASTYGGSEAKWTLLVSNLRKGDVVGVVGHPGKSKRGELSVFPVDLVLLSPCMHMLPKEIKNVETRFRQRYLDLILHPEKRRIFEVRAQIINYVRRFLDERNFLEVETPMMNTIHGGANAAPFKTVHNELNIEMFMRVAPELYLKQLVIGGLDRVYEIGRQFRNEGMDQTHNPEFTTCEFYQAYADYHDLMDMTELMISGMVKAIHGSYKISYTNGDGVDNELDFSPPWPRVSMMEGLAKSMTETHPELGAFEFPDPNGEECKDFLFELFKRVGRVPKPPATVSKMIDQLVGDYLESKAMNPMFITEHPEVMSPLAKGHRSKPGLTERFELFVNQRELCNAYTELNMPLVQRERFTVQASQGAEGDEDAMVKDEDFCVALEYALPPTGGWGMGIDRMAMFLTNTNSIREVLLFPAMKPVGAEGSGEKKKLQPPSVKPPSSSSSSSTAAAAPAAVAAAVAGAPSAKFTVTPEESSFVCRVPTVGLSATAKFAVLDFAAIAASNSAVSTSAPAAPAPVAKAAKKTVKKAPAPAAEEDDDDEMDLGFGDDDDEEEEAAAPAASSRQAMAAKLKAENEKKLEEAKAAALARLAKKEANQRSLCNLEIKPWGEEQDLLALFAKIKKEVVRDGLKWSEGCNLVEVAFGIKKIVCTAIIPVAVSMDEIIDEMTEETFVDDIQSMNMTSMSLL